MSKFKLQQDIIGYMDEDFQRQYYEMHGYNVGECNPNPPDIDPDWDDKVKDMYPYSLESEVDYDIDREAGRWDV